jgi:hypothetical protein
MLSAEIPTVVAEVRVEFNCNNLTLNQRLKIRTFYRTVGETEETAGFYTVGYFF